MWTFLNPLFLWAAAAATIPLLLHLLQKRNTVKVRFSTLRFLQQAQRRSASRVRLENLLLWLLRTLLLLLLAFAFAMPVLRTTGLAGLLGMAQRDVAIVWDVSYSMTYESGRQNVWQTSRDTIANVVRGLQSGDRVCIFLAGDQPTPLIEQPTSDLELALSLIKAQEPQPMTSELRPAIAAALNALRDSGNRERELYVITDGQAVPWKSGETSKLPEELPATFVAMLGAEHPQNTTISSVAAQPTLLLTNTPVRLLAKTAETGTDQDTSVTLFVDDAETARRTGRGELLFPLPPLTKGLHAVRLETAADGLNLDNVFHLLLRVREQLPVLVIGSEADSFFLMKALAPAATTPWQTTRLDPQTPTPANLADYVAVFLVNALPLPGQSILDLENYVRRGGVLIVFPGETGTAADYASWQCLPTRPTGIADQEPNRQHLRLDKPADPLFQDLKLVPGAVPAVTIRRKLIFASDSLSAGRAGSPSQPSEPRTTNTNAADSRLGEPALPGADAETIISAGPHPFLLRRSFGDGKVLLLTVSADRRWSDLPLSPFFLPLVHQFVHYAAGTGGERLFQWTTAELEINVAATELRGPTGETFPVRSAKVSNKTVYVLENAHTPGLYRHGDEPVLALNVARAESNLTPAEEGQLALPGAHIVRDAEELQRLIQQHRIGRPMSETVLWLVLVLALLEVFLANRAGRPTGKLTDHVKVHPSGRVLEKAA